MEPTDYLAILRKHWIGVTVVIVASLASTTLLTAATEAEYVATTRLFFAVPGGESVSDLAQGSSFTERQMSSYAQVATSPIVLGSVVSELGLEIEPSGLASSVRASVPPNTVILEISATSNDPAAAADVANSVGANLARVVSSLYPEREDGSQSVLATTLSTATEPTQPSSPNLKRNLLLGLLLGLVAGIGFAFLRESLDTKIRSTRGVASVTRHTVLGVVAFDSDASAHPIVMIDRPNGARAEAIRRLRTNLQFVDAASTSRVVLVTSSVASEGKTTTVVNLAIAVADAGARVLLVDADLRRPSLQAVLGLEGGAGLTDVLIGRALPQDVIQPWRGGRIDVLASGPVPPNPSELLGSAAMISALDLLKSAYDVVLIDSAPLLPVTDAAVLSSSVDGTLVVVDADRTHKAQLQSSLEALEAVGATVYGIVLNKVDERMQDPYSYSYSYSYDSGSPGGETVAEDSFVGRREGTPIFSTPSTGLAVEASDERRESRRRHRV